MHKLHPARSGHLMLVTANTLKRQPIFDDPACAREAVESLYRIRYWNPFLLFAFVIMPDHCHLLLEIPKNDSISRFVETYKQAVEFELSASAWQPQFHLEVVQACGRVKDYVHQDPVRCNLCRDPAEYPWSSASGRWEVSEMPIVGQVKMNDDANGKWVPMNRGQTSIHRERVSMNNRQIVMNRERVSMNRRDASMNRERVSTRGRSRTSLCFNDTPINISA